MSLCRHKEEELTREFVQSMFSVDVTNGRVFWVAPPKNHPRLANSEAGGPRHSKTNKSYWVIKFGRVAVRRGRLIFFMRHGRWPMPCLDHVDGNSLNDSIANLREATIQQNAMNHKSRAKASPLPMGVRAVRGKFQARIAINKKTIYLSGFGCAESAGMAYEQKRKELFGEFA